MPLKNLAAGEVIDLSVLLSRDGSGVAQATTAAATAANASFGFEVSEIAGEWIAIEGIDVSTGLPTLTITGPSKILLAPIGPFLGLRLKRTDVNVSNGTVSAEYHVGDFAALVGGLAGGATAAGQASQLASLGAPTDAAVVADANGTMIAFLRGNIKILSDMYDAAMHAERVEGPIGNGVAVGATNPLVIGGVDGSGTVQRINSRYMNADGIASTAFQAFMVHAAGLLLRDGANFDRVRGPIIFKSFNAVAINAETTLWTPAAGKKFRIMGGILSVGGAAANVLLKDNTAGTTILIIPKTALDVAVPLPVMGNGVLSAAANNVLTATGIAATTLSGFIFGCEE